MIPLRDNIPSSTTPWVNYSVIVACLAVFLVQANEPPQQKATLVERYAMIPARVMAPDRPVILREQVRVPGGVVERARVAASAAVPAWATLLTCIFLHGGWMHLLGNLWFLFIFGDNVEDRLGHLGYAIFYLACGVAASLAHLAAGPESTLPTIGASGAIAGVMGAYFLLYPHAKVVSLVPIFIFLQIVVLPAPVFLGFWFLLQFLQGSFAVGGTEVGGVAWWAHIGGFVVGLAAAASLGAFGMLRPKVEAIRPHTEHSGAYRLRF